MDVGSAQRVSSAPEQRKADPRTVASGAVREGVVDHAGTFSGSRVGSDGAGAWSGSGTVSGSSRNGASIGSTMIVREGPSRPARIAILITFLRFVSFATVTSP